RQIRRAGEKVVAYSGGASTPVAVADFSVLGELMLRLANQDQTSVSGPWWQLRPGRPAGAEVRRAANAAARDPSKAQPSLAGRGWHLRPGSPAGAEVRRAAIADALARAKDYADAVGARVDR